MGETPVVGNFGNHCTPEHSRKRCRGSAGTMDLPDDDVKCLGDEGQLGSIGGSGRVIPDPQTFEAVVVFEGHPSRSPGSAVDPETPRGAIVLVGVLLPTDVIHAKFVFCYSHTSDRGESRDEFRFPLELCEGDCK